MGGEPNIKPIEIVEVEDIFICSKPTTKPIEIVQVCI